MTVEAAAAYLNAQAPATGTWTPQRVQGVLTSPSNVHGWLSVHGRISRAIGEPSNDALVQNVTDASVVLYAKLLRAPAAGVVNEIGCTYRVYNPSTGTYDVVHETAGDCA